MKNILTRLQEYQHLSRSEASESILSISSGNHSDAEIAAFLFALNMRDITLDELLGFREAMLSLAVPFPCDFPTLDLCGTGGDKKNTFNISTIASFIAAGAGAKVTKHGNYGVSSFCGSSTILESFGYQFSNKVSLLRKQLDQANICFLHAPCFHPAMARVAPVRKALGVQTFFNLLGPLVNPAQPKHQLIGVFDLKVLKLYQLLHQRLEKQVSLAHSLDGYDEISLTSPFKIITPGREQLLHPEQLQFKKVSESDLFGGSTIQTAQKIFLDILTNKGTPAQKQVVLANAATALSNYFDITFNEGFKRAQESLESNKAYHSFQKFITLN